MDNIIQILSKALTDISRADMTAGDNDAAYRKQMRIILNSPGVQNALAKARDAPADPGESSPLPKRKRTPKSKSDD